MGLHSQSRWTLGLKNVVVYGSNGSGKSSFVDGVEYLVSKGKIRDLMHEYSGSKYEKGTISTAAGTGDVPRVTMVFDGGLHVDAQLDRYGAPSFTSDPEALAGFVQTWELEKVVLRQDKVAAFIEKTKGDKYSALLPLLGLHDYESAAENVGKLARALHEEGAVDLKNGQVDVLKEEFNKYFPDLTDEKVGQVLTEIAGRYLPVTWSRRGSKTLWRASCPPLGKELTASRQR